MRIIHCDMFSDTDSYERYKDNIFVITNVFELIQSYIKNLFFLINKLREKLIRLFLKQYFFLYF
jgi:hypothetical protein